MASHGGDATRPQVHETGSEAASFVDKPDVGGESTSDLSKAQIEEYRDAFKLFDKDDNGVISKEELATALRFLGWNPTEKELADMLLEADADENGEINFPKFLTILEKQNFEDPDEEMRAAFRVFDRDGDGFISAAELKFTMMNLGEDLTQQEIDDMMTNADINGDGKVDYNEFVLMMNKT